MRVFREILEEIDRLGLGLIVLVVLVSALVLVTARYTDFMAQSTSTLLVFGVSGLRCWKKGDVCFVAMASAFLYTASWPIGYEVPWIGTTLFISSMVLTLGMIIHLLGFGPNIRIKII